MSEDECDSANSIILHQSVAPQRLELINRRIDQGSAVVGDVEVRITRGVADDGEAGGFGGADVLDRLFGIIAEKGIDTSDKVLIFSGRVPQSVIKKVDRIMNSSENISGGKVKPGFKT